MWLHLYKNILTTANISYHTNSFSITNYPSKKVHPGDRRKIRVHIKKNSNTKPCQTKILYRTRFARQALLIKHALNFFQTFSNTYNIFKKNTTNKLLRHSKVIQTLSIVHFIITSIDIHATHNPIQSHFCVPKSHPNTLCTS
jgi:hypothetical protein